MIRLPSPDALDHNPELAALAVLCVAAIAARSALLSAHAALRDPGAAFHGEEAPAAVPAIALGLVALAEAVEEQVNAYLRALEHERLAGLRASDDNDF